MCYEIEQSDKINTLVSCKEIKPLVVKNWNMDTKNFSPSTHREIWSNIRNPTFQQIEENVENLIKSTLVEVNH